MRHIMVLNPKGGCGKSTLATNLASYYASQGKSVAIVDYDPQRSSLDWLEPTFPEGKPTENQPGVTLLQKVTEPGKPLC